MMSTGVTIGAQLFSSNSSASAEESSNTPKPTTYEWTARVRCIPSESGCEDNFTVYVFCGDIPKDPRWWDWAPSLAGTCSFMVYPGDDPVESFAFLSNFMLEKGGLKSLEEDVVVPYLREKLCWGTQLAGGVVLPSENFKSLEIVVLSTPLYEQPDDFPELGTIKEYPGITYGRPGGSKVKG